MNTENKITLYYFNFMGRAEISRSILHYNDVQFEDKRLSFEEWGEMKANGGDKVPFGQLPILDYNGRLVAQSHCIARYLAQKYGQYPTDLDLQTDVEMLRETINTDINEEWVKGFWIKDETQKKEFMDNFFGKKFPEKLAIFDKWLNKNGNNGYLVGDSMTLADFALLDLAGRFLDDKRWAERSATVFESFSNIQNYLKIRREDTKYKNYLSKRIIPTF